MRIKRLPILFHNVLGMKIQCPLDEWLLYMASIRNNIVLNDLYATGPISYQVEDTTLESDEMIFTFYQPVNESLIVDNDDEFFFQEELYFEDGLLIRCVEIDSTEDMYEMLELAAKELNVTLQKPYLQTYLNVYGDGMLDIYAPIVKELEND